MASTTYNVAYPVNFYSGGDTTKEAFGKHIQEIQRIYGIINALNADKVSADEVTTKTDTDGTTIYVIKIRNSSGIELPHTGGSGTLPYTFGGIAFITASALMYGFRKRRRERRLNR